MENVREKELEMLLYVKIIERLMEGSAVFCTERPILKAQ